MVWTLKWLSFCLKRVCLGGFFEGLLVPLLVVAGFGDI